MRQHVIAVSSAFRYGTKHPNAFEARLAGGNATLCDGTGWQSEKITNRELAGRAASMLVRFVGAELCG